MKPLLLILLLPVIISCSATKPTTTTRLDETMTITEYRLDTGDLLRLEIQGEENTLLEVRLDESGLISYLQLDEAILAQGKTLAELKNYLTNQLQPDFYKAPNLLVTITEYRPFFINGQVNNPGAYPYQPGLNVAKAITLAGGKTQRAGDIDILRADNKKLPDVSLQEIIKPGDIISIDDSWM